MRNWSFDILRQSGWDLWVLVCAAAALVLLSYGAVGRVWRRPGGWAALALIILGCGGTAAIFLARSLQNPRFGLAWTFLVLAALSAVFYLQILPQLGPRRTGGLLAMRLLALAMLVPMLFEPVLRYVVRPKPERPLLFLLDGSGSMSFPDVPNGPTRLQSAANALRPELQRIRDRFVPSFYTFAGGLTELKPDQLAAVTPDGKFTDIVAAIRALQPRITRGDAQVVLISDGIDNIAGDSVADKLRDVVTPVHTLCVGSEQAEPASMPNIAVENIDSADEFVVGHESSVKVTIKSTSLKNRVVSVKMGQVDPAGKPVGNPVAQNVVLKSAAEAQTLELPWKPTAVGLQRLAVWVDPIPGERSAVDNRQEFQGLAIDPRIKVLYVEGSARAEYRELTRALVRDNIELATLLRIREQSFAAGGTVDAAPFTARGVPTRLEEWKKFDVIIIGDLDSSFLPPAAQASLEQFVSGGGGLLMTGGARSFGRGGYKGTPVEKALPVFVGDVNAPQETLPFIPRLTAEGAAHASMAGLDKWFGVEQRKGDATLPQLTGHVVVAGAKSGAQVLAVHPDRPGPDGKPQVVLAVQRYSKGCSAAFTADTTWRWYLPLRGLKQESPYNRFWGQLIRWLAGADVRNRQRGPGVEGLLNKSNYQLGESVRIRAMVRDDRGDATAYAQVQLKLKTAGKPDRDLPLNPVENHPGQYDVTIPGADLAKGDWTVELSAAKDGKPLGRQELKFTIFPPAEEMLKLAARPDLLAAIAAATGPGGPGGAGGAGERHGFHYRIEQLPALIDQLIRADRTAVQAREETVALANTARATLALLGQNPSWSEKWDLPLQGLLVITLLAAEWLLRRHWQLP